MSQFPTRNHFGKRKPNCHPKRPHAAKGLCATCYQRQKVSYTDQRLIDLRRRYRITSEQWEKLYTLQQGLCPICMKSLPRPAPRHRAAPVDHDHISGRVRGLSCHKCNRWYIGSHTLETARRLVVYLESDVDGRLL